MNSMLRRLTSRVSLSGNSAAFSDSETIAMERLATAHAQMMDMRRGSQGEASDDCCSTCLACLEGVAELLGVAVADRSYRNGFSANYRALFPDGDRRYRVDVFEASAEQQVAIWVNGDKFELSVETIALAEALQQAWVAVGEQLERWRLAAEGGSWSRPSRQEMATVLTAQDQAWARFEHRYVSELIGIETQARQVIVRAIEQERRLARIGHRRCGVEYREEQRQMVATIAQLNSVANQRRKGRDDLGANILDSALVVLRRSDSDLPGAVQDPNLSTARCMANDVVNSFDAICQYLREVSQMIERVDPHLCNNVGLVTRLVDWEESWEIGAKYVCDAALLDAMCDAVSQVRTAQQLAPSLMDMCTDFDVELFLVLPRLVLLSFAAEQTRALGALVRHLLPHRFAPGAAAAARAGPLPELQSFAEHYQRVVQQLGCGETRVVERLTRRAVAGSYEVADPTPKSESAAQKHRAVEGFMRELEGWSLELQRHCPEDWNQCSALILRCLTASGDRQPAGQDTTFQV